MSELDEAAVRDGHAAASEWAQVEGAFSRVEAVLMRALIDTPIGQETKVMNLHKALQNLSAVQDALMDVIKNGQVAEYAISQARLTSPY